MRQFIIVGDNNFWYDTICIDDADTPQVQEHFKRIEDFMKKNLYDDKNLPKVEKLFCYEVINHSEKIIE